MLRKMTVTNTHIAWLHLHKTSKVVKLLESRIVITRGWGKGDKGVILQRVEGFSF